MTAAQAPSTPPGSQPLPRADIYAASRCVNCRHLRYLGQKPGESCWVCDCTQHRIPSEAASEATS